MRDVYLAGGGKAGNIYGRQTGRGGDVCGGEAGNVYGRQNGRGGRPLRSAGIDYFRMAAAFMVIAIHIAPFADWSKEADFLITYCLGRTAVPFFFMTTGYFVLAPYVKSGFRKKRSFYKFMLKNTALYLAVTLLYLPLTVYSGNMPDSIGELLRALFLDGTFYHLWYFPAVLTGCALLVLLMSAGSRSMAPACQLLGNVDIRAAVVFSLISYVIGLLGDSYYGLAEQVLWVKTMYDGIFHISSYTRNGIFFAPIFLMMGMLTASLKQLYPMRICVWGTALSAVFLMGEGFLTYSLKWQRHNSMYVFLVPLMFFLFQLLLMIPGRAPAFCRNGSLVLYVIHPAVIVVLRGVAKGAQFTEFLIDRAFIQYITVCMLSTATAVIYVRAKEGLMKNMKK